MTVAAALPAAAQERSHSDAELIRICHQFAESEYASWYRYCTLPNDLADELTPDPDRDTLRRIEAMPATTPEGWRAKALVCAAWNREMYDDPEDERHTGTPILTSLLRDMVAPTRNAILARLAAEYGPLSEGYTADRRWMGSDRVPVSPPAWDEAPDPDADLIRICAEHVTNVTAYNTDGGHLSPPRIRFGMPMSAPGMPSTTPSR